jgi:acyl-CoA synthetase (AMP-forming)/AMP-acid ligase II
MNPGAVVAGLGVHDQLPGEVGLYCVQLRAGAQATEHELRDFWAQRLADYTVPRHFAWPDVLPLTPAGKVAKSELKKRYG